MLRDRHAAEAAALGKAERREERRRKERNGGRNSGVEGDVAGSSMRLHDLRKMVRVNAITGTGTGRAWHGIRSRKR